MIRRIEALNYRCLRYVCRELGPFHVLVGANGSGKSTFLDVVGFMGDLLTLGVEDAVARRAPSFQDLTWMRQGTRIELAVELEIPEGLTPHHVESGWTCARYEIALGLDQQAALAILGENLILKPMEPTGSGGERSLFPDPGTPPAGITYVDRKIPSGWRKVVSKTEPGNDYFHAETTKWKGPFRLGPRRLALANLPEDERQFPAAVWVKRRLMEGVHRLALNSEAMRRPAPPGKPESFLRDGSNLPQVMEKLRASRVDRFDRWLDHVRTALPSITSIDAVTRPEDKHVYLRIGYDTGLQAPSWSVSDGTLRLLALTLLAYLEDSGRIYLIEEPENGIHPQAVETVHQSLSSIHDGQVLCASHSPLVLSLTEPEQVLCFAQAEDGATDVVTGAEHPRLREWKRQSDLGTLLAAGVLG